MTSFIALAVGPHRRDRDERRTTGARAGRAARAPLRVRRAGPGDAAALAATMRASIRTLGRGAYPPRTLAAWSSLPALYHAWAMTAGGETCLAAERAGRVVGYAALRGAELTALFVRPGAARGGVGTALLRRVEALARRRGEAALWTKAARSGAAFYRARGFAGERPVRVALPGGGALEAVLLRKRLAGAPRPRGGGPVTPGRTGAGTGSGGTRSGPRAAGTRRPAPRSAPDRRGRPASPRSRRASRRRTSRAPPRRR